MGHIPEEIIDRVKHEANIVDVISDYVRLRRAGKNWIGLCPFHDDKHPSFAVEPVRGIYRCFSCGKGGNVFTFLMERNGWTFPESVRNLAQTLNIEIPEEGRDRGDYSESERLAAAVRDAARYFYGNLQSERGEHARAYLRNRGFANDTITRFGIGYSLDEWEALITHLRGKGYEDGEIERAGLAIRRDDRKSFYDRFRGRTMFPVFTATGRVVGFGARRMNEDPNSPKYINSPETRIYQKSRVLYGLFQAKDAIRRSGRALFVEGYADVISLHQAGVETAIATCGTAIAREHADLIARFCSRVVLVFDSDAAGQSATERGIDVLLAKGLDVAVLRLPDGEDPDTFVQKFGAKEFERRLDESVTFLEFRTRVLKRSGAFDSPETMGDAIRSIVSTLAMIPDALKRELYVNKLASEYHVNERLMIRELERALGQQRGTMRRRELLRPSSPAPDRPMPPIEGTTTQSPRENATAGSGENDPAGVNTAEVRPTEPERGGNSEATADASEEVAGSDVRNVPAPEVEHGEKGEAGGQSEPPQSEPPQSEPPQSEPPQAEPPQAELTFDEAVTPPSVHRGSPELKEEPAAPALRPYRPLRREELPQAELQLLSVLVDGDPQMLENVFARVDVEHFTHPATRQLIEIILGHYVNQRSFTIDELVMEELEPRMRDLVTLLAVQRESISDHWESIDPDLGEPNRWRIARDCLIQLLENRIEREHVLIQDQLRPYTVSGAPGEDDLGDEEEERKKSVLERVRVLAEERSKLATLRAGG